MRRAIPFLATLALLGGCFTLPPGPGPDLSTPYNTLSFLVNSYSMLDESGMDYILSDDFVFAFDQREWGDTVNGYKIPIDWGIYSELIATRHMFEDADNILISLKLEDMEPLPEGATRYSSGWIEYIINFNSLGGESYYVIGHALFDMEKVGEDWIITRWSDLIYENEHSWGWLKALYRLN
jgi:hypothetical protein